MSGYVRHPKYHELFKKPGSSVWWAFIPREGPGRMLRESTGQRDDVAAHRWFIDRLRSGASRDSATVHAAVSKTRERTLAEALSARLEWIKAARANDDPTRRKLAAATIDFYERKSKTLSRVLGADTKLSELSHERIRAYIVTRSAKARATTIAKELTTLSGAMRLARKDGYACPDFRDIKPDDFAAVYVPKTRWLSEDEVDGLVFSGVLPPRRAAVVAFMVATSATYPSEVLPVLRDADIDPKTYTVHVPGKKRGTRDRTLRVPSYARRYLDFALKHGSGHAGRLFEPWSNIRRDLHDAARLLSMCTRCREARLAWARHEVGSSSETPLDCQACKNTPRFEALCPTDLRRTFAQWLVRAGVSYELAAPMMGHNGTKMLQLVYGKRDATAVADLVELALKKAPKNARRRAPA